ncbi:MAG TPA: RDD family protein [Caulobacteraceae bacterium]|nr:RDD family protein [Caulobacteraceae bacterium]
MAAADAASAADAKVRREFVTPEGVDLGLRIGEASERAGAFLLDAAIIIGGMIALTLLCILALAGGRGNAGEWIAVVWLVGFFCARNVYFIAFELGPRAATPGKRALGLRVAARRGGRLSADAIFARNAMREIEVYLPLTFLIARGRDVDAWLILLGCIWCGVFALFPLFNRDRLRIGDLVAGTWVVKTARRRLLPDLVERGAGDQRFSFTQAQVDAYGVKELHVLEDVLRRNHLPTVSAVAERIRGKIGWIRGAEEADWAFLDAYYAALRRRLETRMLLGKRRRDKFDVG